jgi:ribosome biogenesis GTPase A
MVAKKIQWYPGHMHKASKEITAMLGKVDVCIELQDARIPFSSENPMLASLRGRKPCLKVLSKPDLADPQLTILWHQHYGSITHTKVLVADTRKAGSLTDIPAMCRSLYSENGGSRPIITAMVMGIPNVGKSTLINALSGRIVAKTGNEPAVTKVQQVVEIAPGFVLLDTPGLMWPNVESRNSGYRLAITGAIRDTAISHEDVALFAADYFLEAYPDRLIQRYHLEQTYSRPEELLEEIGRRRGCLIKGGKVDRDRAAKLLLSDIRSGSLGRFTLETPQMMGRELQLVELERQQKAERKLERKRNWKDSTR